MQKQAKERSDKPIPERKVKTSVSFPDDLWKEGRKRAIDESRDFQELIVDALRKYLRAERLRRQPVMKSRIDLE